MTLNPEHIIINGFDRWEGVQISASMRKAAREFSVYTTERLGEFTWPPGTPVTILANGTLMVDGYVNRYQPSFDAKSHRINVSGRSAAQDFVDCAAIDPNKKSHWKDKKPDEIAQQLDQFGVGVTAEIPLKPIKYFQLDQGETAHAAVERALRDQKATMMGAERGIKITNAKAAKRHSGGLIEGFNILRANATLSDDRQHSETAVKGQRREGTEDADLKIHEKAQNSQVKRYRPKLLVSETDTDKGRARERAEHESNRAAGFGISATITVQGWRDDGGQVFQPNYLIFVQSPTLKIFGDMLIEAVTWKQDDKNGSTADIHIVNAKAYEGKGGANQSDAGWGG
jgi:prophage tail gpP-like protein